MSINDQKRCLLSVKVIPKSSINALVEYQESILKIKIKAAPEKGKANKELIHFISKILAISSSNIQILKGHGSQSKLLAIDIDYEDMKERIISHLGNGK